MDDNPTLRSPLEGLSQARFQGRTFPQEKVTSIGTALVTLLPNNPNRTRWIIINESANDIRVSNDPTITASSGWLLVANGGVISQDFEADGEGVGYAVYAIGLAAASNVRSREVIRL